MPGDFREHFDLRQIDQRSLDQIAFVLNSPAYETSFKPYLQGVLNNLNRLWKDRSKQRADQYPDDFLAGGVVFGEGLLKFFDLLIQETSMERIHAAMSDMPADRLYDLKREAGQQQPVIGFDQPALPEPYDPAEDF